MKKILSLILVVIAILTLLAGCGGNSEPSGSDATPTPASSGGTSPSNGGNTGGDTPKNTSVTIGYVGTHDNSYPMATNSNDFITQRMLYDKLFEVDDHTGEFTSRLLESWSWDDNVTLKLVLRQDIYFSDGNQMTGEDVLYSMYNFIEQGMNTDKYNQYYNNIDFDKSHVGDDGFTVYIVYQREYSSALNVLDLCILEKSFVQAHDETDAIWYNAPVGSGPYEITEVVMDSYIVFTLRDDYWNPDYSFDATEVTLRFYTDSTGMYADYQNGIIDAMYDVPDTILQQVLAKAQGGVTYVSTGDVPTIKLNVTKEYTSDINVRKAVVHAVDWAAVRELAFGSLGKEATSHYGADFPCYVYHEPYEYNPDYSKQVLEDAGYSSGEITLQFVAVNMNTQKVLAEAIQGYLKAVGINLEISSYDLGTALPILMEPDQADMFYMMNGAGNATRNGSNTADGYKHDSPYKSAARNEEYVNELHDLSVYNVDEESRMQALKDLDDWLFENYWSIPVCERYSAIVYNDRISSFDQASIPRGCLGSLTLS